VPTTVVHSSATSSGEARPRRCPPQAGSRPPDATLAPVSTVSGRPELLLRRGRRLEYATLAWNFIGVVILAINAGSVVLAGFGLDSLIEIGASWMCTGI
jgi:hypothetical protein